MELILNCFGQANPLLGALEGMGPGNLELQGPPFPVSLVMDIALLRSITYTAPYKQQVH